MYVFEKNYHLSTPLLSGALVISSVSILDSFSDGSENLKGRVHRLHLDVTEVGSERSMSTSGQYLQVMAKC